MDVYVEEFFEQGNIHPSTKILCKILDVKYGKSDLNKVVNKQCQHLLEDQNNSLQRLLEKFEDFLYGTLGTQKMDPIDFELKEDAKPIC